MTDDSVLPSGELFAVLEGLVNEDPGRRGQETLFGGFEPTPEKKGRARKAAERAPLQLELLGRGISATAPLDSRQAARAALGPLFQR